MPQTAALITALILERPMCLACIAMKSTTSETAVQASLVYLAQVLRIRRESPGRCRACGQNEMVVSVTRPDMD